MKLQNNKKIGDFFKKYQYFDFDDAWKNCWAPQIT